MIVCGECVVIVIVIVIVNKDEMNEPQCEFSSMIFIE